MKKTINKRRRLLFDNFFSRFQLTITQTFSRPAPPCLALNSQLLKLHLLVFSFTDCGLYKRMNLCWPEAVKMWYYSPHDFFGKNLKLYGWSLWNLWSYWCFITINPCEIKYFIIRLYQNLCVIRANHFYHVNIQLFDIFCWISPQNNQLLINEITSCQS